MSSVLEETYIDVVISPFDSDGAAFTPGSARYKLNDQTAGTEIIAWTVIATPSTEMTVRIPASDNAMINEALTEEVKVVTVQTDYGTDDQLTHEREYTVINGQFV